MKDIATLFSDAFGSKSRFKILDVLASRQYSVNDIARISGLSQTNVSHNLRLLSDYKIVNQKVIGKSHIYYINDNLEGFVVSVLKNAKKHEKALKTTAILAFAVVLATKPLLTHEVGTFTYQSSFSLFSTFRLILFN
ncbi:MAG: ArsR family transcriptional regulator [Candidatus Marsarchaeota archaeon]|jgi:DNA-binding transcriptional ArsR family regulator|nr:ArsR family transcriptional regulator [Candidatus Marsarchaeota archaeon]